MKKSFLLLSFVLVFSCVWLVLTPLVSAAEPIVVGVPTSLGFLEGKEKAFQD
ncbi:MAG: hypothetical protein JRF52_14010 [Deltaproteobacteria bacterium]|nr:hypothetical protein [Deltaproteobacteria bacterium]